MQIFETVVAKKNYAIYLQLVQIIPTFVLAFFSSRWSRNSK